MLAARTQVGATLNRVDAVTGRLSALKLSSQTEESNATDLDMTQAISDFSSQQTGYDAALKAYSLVQKLSLFNYLSP
jgi:flagellar hook-associated protein 3 FlgL